MSTATSAKPPSRILENGKKTKGKVKIKMEYIDDKVKRYTTFSKRKTGLMKKAYELSTLTGTQVMMLVASETGHVYTFATSKLKPIITSEAGKALIQTCLRSPEPPPSQQGTQRPGDVEERGGDVRESGASSPWEADSLMTSADPEDMDSDEDSRTSATDVKYLQGSDARTSSPVCWPGPVVCGVSGAALAPAAPVDHHGLGTTLAELRPPPADLQHSGTGASLAELRPAAADLLPAVTDAPAVASLAELRPAAADLLPAVPGQPAAGELSVLRPAAMAHWPLEVSGRPSQPVPVSSAAAAEPTSLSHSVSPSQQVAPLSLSPVSSSSTQPHQRLLDTHARSLAVDARLECGQHEPADTTAATVELPLHQDCQPTDLSQPRQLTSL